MDSAFEDKIEQQSVSLCTRETCVLLMSPVFVGRLLVFKKLDLLTVANNDNDITALSCIDYVTCYFFSVSNMYNLSALYCTRNM